MTEAADLVAKRSLRPVNLIPVGLKEAAWDSPSFRASTIHTFEQVEAVERWIESCVRATTRLASEGLTLETLLSTFISSAVPPQSLSEAIVDHDYSLVAAKRFAEAAKDSWLANIAELKKLDTNIAEPLKHFLQTDLRGFKDGRRTLESTQRTFDTLQSRYSGQAKTKEPSSLREDAFQLHEARKAYLKASLDLAIGVPQLKLALDKLLARIFSDQTQAMRNSRDATSIILAKYATEVGRIRSWSKEVESGEKTFRKELLATRSQIEEAAELAARPSRELEDYAATTVGAKGPSSNLQAKPHVSVNGKQGWLNMKIVTGKQARTLWIRRWFFVKNGVFGWLVQGTRSGGVEESERIGVLLCGLRPAVGEERRFCFEVKTKDITIVLQAESHSELAQWRAAFDIAKSKALEDPASTNIPAAAPKPQDLAFAVSRPSTIEFTASVADVGLTTDGAQDRVVSNSLGVPGDPMTPTHRGSFDVTATRRSSGIDTDPNKGGRKVSATPSIGPTGSPNPSAGIAGLIQASNMTLPLGTGAVLPIANTEPTRSFTASITKTSLGTIIRSLPKSSLAPSTLMNPPVQTNLSNATVLLNGEKGNASAQMDLVKGTPSGMMANSWGSLNWAYNNLLQRQDAASATVTDPESAMSGPPSPDKKVSGTVGRSQSTSAASPRGHRKTVSLDGDAADFQRTLINPGSFPNYYPMLLKHHDAQLRVLFPNVPREDKLILVFRATWSPSDEGEFPGRIYVTSRDIYFYSNHLGLILNSSLPLARVTEITAAPGRECDYLFMHLKESPSVDYTRITVKVFLEPLKLLQKRLNYLVQNANKEQPDDLEAIMRAMLRFELPATDGERSPSVASTDGQGANDSLFSPRGQVSGKDLRTRLRVDQDILGLRSPTEKEKIKLPNRPVDYIPNGMTSATVAMNFKISPKALFHILFGDRSVIWQVLYHQRGAQSVRQGPWTRESAGQLRRVFNFRVPKGPTTGLTNALEVTDTQTVDVQSEHLCYVVTERKSAWSLPLCRQLELITKIVITHVSKSNCKLAIYTGVNWNKPSFLRWLIDYEAFASLKLDALDLMDVVSEQVDRLGHQNQSKKAIQIFGQVGVDTQIVEFRGTDSATVPRVRHMAQKKSITRLFFGAYGSFIAGCVNVVLAQIIAIFDWGVSTFNANFWLVLLFAISFLVNVFFTSSMGTSWWQDLRAGHYMQSLGITKDLVMTRAISLADLDLVVAPLDNMSENMCYQTFRKGSSLSSFSSHPAPSRLRKSQTLLGTYRHDLIVAMRVLNSMEQEMVQAEWEYWLEDEAKRCSLVRKVISKGKTGSSTQKGNTTSNAAIEKLTQYCSSCENSRRSVNSGKS